MNNYSSSYTKSSLNRASYFSNLSAYIGLRIRQLRIATSLSGGLLSSGIVSLKEVVVRNMYWGRGSLYKTSFHFIVILMTFVALLAGIGPRIVSTQRVNASTVALSGARSSDSDLDFQLAKLTPTGDFTGDTLYYTRVVKTGESLQSIVDEINKQIEQGGQPLTTDVLRWANGIANDRNTLNAGQSLKIPLVNGVLYTVVAGDTVDKVLAKVKLDNREANLEDFRSLNSSLINDDGTLVVGSTILLPNASIIPAAPARPSRPTTSRPTNPVVNVPAGRFVNPVQNCPYGISRGYRTGHTGVDLAVNRGCVVVAAGSGVIVRAGICNDLGYCVQIKHAGGVSTIYGHGNGVFYVRAGQEVAAGQRIMQSGCSGRCSGPHVHLSVAVNNNDVFGCYSCRINPKGIIPY